MYPPEVGLHAEDLVLQQWKEQVQAAQAAARARLDTLGLVDSRTDDRDRRRRHAGTRRWTTSTGSRAEVLVVGSSRAGRLARVFLGSAAIKIVRYSPVPVVVVPAAVAAEVAETVQTEPAERSNADRTGRASRDGRPAGRSPRPEIARHERPAGAVPARQRHRRRRDADHRRVPGRRPRRGVRHAGAGGRRGRACAPAPGSTPTSWPGAGRGREWCSRPRPFRAPRSSG